MRVLCEYGLVLLLLAGLSCWEDLIFGTKCGCTMYSRAPAIATDSDGVNVMSLEESRLQPRDGFA